MTIDKLIDVSLFVLLFFTPLVFDVRTNEAFEFAKMNFVYFVGLTLVLVWSVGKFLSEKNIIDTVKKSFKNRTMVDSLVILWVLTNVVSTVFSSHFHTSIWGYYSRFNGGLASTIIFFAIYLVVRAKKIKSSDILENKMYLAIVLSTAPITLNGIYQKFVFENSKRIYSTLGQPNWLAAYLVMALPFVLYFALKSSDNKKWFYGGMFITAYANIWFSYSISGLLGFAIGITTFLVLNKKLVLTNQKFLGILFGVCFLLSILFPGIHKQRFEDVFIDLRKVSAQENLVGADSTVSDTTVNNISDPGFIRTHMWKGTLNLIKSDPKIMLIGTGPETFPYEFQKFRPPELNYSSEWDFILNKPHNYFLEEFSEVGLLGVLQLVGIVVLTTLKRNKLLTPVFVGFYVTSFFGFPVVTTSLMFWVCLGLCDKMQ